MKYIKSDFLDQLSDNSLVYVNRNVLNVTIAQYEINTKRDELSEELRILLSVWNNTYEAEKKNKRIEVFIKMRNKDIKKCFKNYRSLPLGSFGIVHE